MHVFYPGAVGSFWIPSFYVQIFCKLPPDTHSQVLIIIVNIDYNNRAEKMFF